MIITLNVTRFVMKIEIGIEVTTKIGQCIFDASAKVKKDYSAQSKYSNRNKWC